MKSKRNGEPTETYKWFNLTVKKINSACVGIKKKHFKTFVSAGSSRFRRGANRSLW